jgi:hypothetical protein
MGADASRKPYLFAPVNISQTSNNNPLATIARAAPTIHTSALQFTLDVAPTTRHSGSMTIVAPIVGASFRKSCPNRGLSDFLFLIYFDDVAPLLKLLRPKRSSTKVDGASSRFRFSEDV